MNIFLKKFVQTSKTSYLFKGGITSGSQNNIAGTDFFPLLFFFPPRNF